MSNYNIRTSMLNAYDMANTSGFKVISTNTTLKNYSHVLLDTYSTTNSSEPIDGEFIVFNAPSSIPARKFYLEVIRIAEMRNIDKNNGIGDSYITITDITKIISKINSSPMRISHGRIFLQITGSKLTDILPGKIECWYKFPADNAYMVICKSRPNLIEIMPGDMKFNKEVDDKNVDN